MEQHNPHVVPAQVLPSPQRPSFVGVKFVGIGPELVDEAVPESDSEDDNVEGLEAGLEGREEPERLEVKGA